MNAVAPVKSAPVQPASGGSRLININLPANDPYDRKLAIKLAGNCLSVALTGPKRNACRVLAWAVADMAEVYLNSKPTGCCLWVATSAFEVSDSEAVQIRETFAAAGVHIKGLVV